MKQAIAVQQLKEQLQAVRATLIEHPLYNRLKTIEGIQVFTASHVFAVWDFMSLLTSLQQQLTCVQTPWIPVGNANSRYLINEIVLGEESDVDANGNRISHFELYLQAMQELGADTSGIEQLLTYIANGETVRTAMQKLQLPEAIQQFTGYTFDIVEKAPVHVQAAVFTFGREDLIPAMFIGIVKELEKTYPKQINTFRYYLERHIEVDGDHHSHLGIEMVSSLCGDNDTKWQEATQASIQALEKRKLLWDHIAQALEQQAGIPV